VTSHRPVVAVGCFPHLGRGVSSAPAIACSDGYTALLRLLWVTTARTRDSMPARITRAAPDAFAVEVPQSVRPSLHAFLSGSSARLLDELDAPARSELVPGFVRDRDAAHAFFTAGPRAIRSMRLRHRLPAGPVSRAQFVELLTAELRASIGDFRLPRPPDATDDALGRRAHRWTR
jgi:hypothetical protein